MRSIEKNKLIKLLSIILTFYIIFYLIVPAAFNKSYAASRVTGIDQFPESYREPLRKLQQLHPNWTFTALNTGLDWNTVIYNQTSARHGRNLVQGKGSEWICGTCGNKVYDGSNWVCASESAVKYMMDPRNFLNELYIFQFEALSYSAETQTREGVEKILQGTFMYNAKISYKDAAGNTINADKTYSEVIMEAGRSTNVSPYHLASRIRQEIGTTPSASVTGNVDGYKGIYNFYSIGAYDGANAVQNGLSWASSGTTYNRPWTSPEKSIIGGAQFIAKDYISIGQDTLYLQKFDVDDSDGSLYSHQYMTNCLAPYNETRSIFSTYLNNALLNNSFNFIIPVFNNMPGSTTNPSDSNYAGFTNVTEVIYGANMQSGSALNVRSGPGTNYSVISYAYNETPMVRIANGNGWSKVMLSGAVIGYVSNDYVTTNKPVNQGESTPVSPPVTIVTEAVRVKITEGYVNVRSSPSTSGAVIATLNNGEELARVEKGTTLINGYYWDKVILKDGKTGYVVTNYLEVVLCENFKVENGKIIAEPDVSVKTLIEKNSGKEVRITKADGTPLGGNDLIGTGCIVTMDGASYAFIKMGDVSGDGKINSADLLAIQKHLLGVNNISNTPYGIASDINKDGQINSADLLSVQKYLLGVANIKI